MNILGISYSMHESAACLLQDGELKFACAEERLSKVKQDAAFPVRSIQAALDHAVKIAGPIPHHLDRRCISRLLLGSRRLAWRR